ncbi:MAG: energy-coupling factor transporter transmembrane component T [Planctomycetota bacterium]
MQCGVLLLAACMVAPTRRFPEILFIVFVTAGWTLLCAPPRKTLLHLTGYAGILFLPIFLLAPWINAPSSPWTVPLEIFLHGTICLFLSISTIASLDLSEAHDALSALPLPEALTSLLIQIVHQTATLETESRRMACAIKVRGAPSGGMLRMRLFSSLPTAWLLRIAHRAERVALAMTLRGLGANSFVSSGKRLSAFDILSTVAALILLGIALTLRWGPRS